VRAAALYARAAGVDSGGPEAPLAILRLTRPGPDSARALVRRAVWHGMAAMERLEAAALAGAPSPGAASDPGARFERLRRRRALASLETALRAVADASWGPAELDQLRLAWPHSQVLERAAAGLAERGGDAEGALAAVDRLLRAAPADAGLQCARGRLLARLGRPAEAAQAYARALDLAPEDDSTFRALQRLDESRGALGGLLDQILRLRIRLPGSAALAEHETEVRQRLGGAPAPHAPASPAGGERR
jgi:tetratricopeptide (TPR) repeat protein